MRPPLADALDVAPHSEGGWYRPAQSPSSSTVPAPLRPMRCRRSWSTPTLLRRWPAGVWQRTVPSDADALVSCLVSPGFDFADFELAAG